MLAAVCLAAGANLATEWQLMGVGLWASCSLAIVWHYRSCRHAHRFRWAAVGIVPVGFAITYWLGLKTGVSERCSNFVGVDVVLFAMFGIAAGLSVAIPWVIVRRTVRCRVGETRWRRLPCLFACTQLILVALVGTRLPELGADLTVAALIGHDTVYSAGYTHQRWRRLRVGATESDVMNILGPPLDAWQGPRHITWKYALSPTSGDQYIRTVVFERGRVVGVFSGFNVD